jgi:Family of unknown function (DUF5519)
MRSPEKTLEDKVAAWPNISVHPHRFGGREFRFNTAEVGHVHIGGIVDIPFPRALRDALLEDRLAEEHHWVPDSGWTTFRMRTGNDLDHALWLLRLSWVRYALKTDSDPHRLFQEETKILHLNPGLASLLARFVPAAPSGVATTIS